MTIDEAQAKLDATLEKLYLAYETVKTLQAECTMAKVALHQSRIDIDSVFPRCKMVYVSRYTGHKYGDRQESVVIIRRTKNGELVVRPIGNQAGKPYKFKWREFTHSYVQSESVEFSGVIRELRDVPSEYLPRDH